MSVVRNSVAVAVGKGALGGDGFRGWRVAENEEFYKNAEEDYDGDLTEEKPFSEG